MTVSSSCFKIQRRGGKEAISHSVFHRRASGHDRPRHDALAVWLKRNGFRADQVQTFYPGPMATATAMYHSGRNPLKKVTRASESVDIVRGERRRRLHKAFLRYHDPKNWPLLREALQAMGRADLIGNGKQHLVPRYQPAIAGDYQSARRKNSTAAGSPRLPGHTAGASLPSTPVCRRAPACRRRLHVPRARGNRIGDAPDSMGAGADGSQPTLIGLVHESSRSRLQARGPVAPSSSCWPATSTRLESSSAPRSPCFPTGSSLRSHR